MASPSESALVALVPEAEILVKPFRNRYDPSAAEGMPAHITVLYPFKPPADFTRAVLLRLRKLFAGLPSLHFSLGEVRRFPDVLYLAPSPDEPFVELIHAVAAEYPEAPPYGGAHDQVIPHLTVAHLADFDQLERVAEDFLRAAQGKLPIPARVAEIALMDNATGAWQARVVFPLSGFRY